MPAFAVARLIPIPRGISEDPQKLASLRLNKDPRNPKHPAYINSFPIQAHSRLEGKEWVVDYNQTIAIPGSEFPSIRRHKILQMENDYRVKFKIKLAGWLAGWLAACLTRLMDEEREAGLENPWIGRQAPIRFPE